MKKIWEFLKTTIIGGLVLIIPLAVLTLALGHIFDLFVALNSELATFLPFGTLGRPGVAIAAAVIGIVLVCFVAGLLLRTGFGKRAADSVNQFLDNKIPMYAMVRNLAKRLTGDEIMQFTPTEIDLYGSGTRSLGFIIEKLPDGRFVVFVPSSPTLTVGQLSIAPEDNLTRIEKPPILVVDAITQWGTGTKDLYETDAAGGD